MGEVIQSLRDGWPLLKSQYISIDVTKLTIWYKLLQSFSNSKHEGD